MSQITVSESVQPPDVVYVAAWERGIDPWHSDAFPSELKHIGTKGERKKGWYGLDWCGNVVYWCPDGETFNVEDKQKMGVKPEDLDNLFSYHPPKGDQAERYEKINEAAKNFAKVVLENTPGCADQTDAIRKIREARMTANSAIACNE